MKELIERLERATDGSHALDHAIAKRFYAAAAVDQDVFPAYTSSLDTAMTLVPPGLDWAVHQTADGVFATVLTPDAVEHEGVSDKPALALCIAALKARK
jgi:hypothetical protein